MAKNIIDYDGNSVADPPGTYPSSNGGKPQTATINLVIHVPDRRAKRRKGPKSRRYSESTIGKRLKQMEEE